MAKKYDIGESLVFRYLIRNRQDVKSNICWNIHSGTYSFWWDNWFGDGALAKYCEVYILNNTPFHFS